MTHDLLTRLPAICLILALHLLPSPLEAQYCDSVRLQEKLQEQYAVNPFVSVPAILAGGILNRERLLKLQDKNPVDRETFLADEAQLRADVPGIDRIALRQDFSKHKDAIRHSDNLFLVGQFAPFSLFIWKKYRQNWLNISLVYMEAQVTQGLFYGYAPFGAGSFDRLRPRVFYEEAEEESRFNDGNQRNAMFSGHVSTMATGFYFTAKMIDDHNPQFSTGKRILLYSAATLPSVLGGYLRIRGLKHYPTDTFVGLGVGAISGILVPQLHRWWAERFRSRVAARGIYTGDAVGVGLQLRF